MQRKLSLLFAVIALAPPMFFAQVTNPSSGSQATQPAAKGISEADALRQQNELLWKFDQRLLNAVNYGLLAILFVATAGSVVNFLNARRELASLRKDIEQGLKRSVEGLNRDADGHRRDFDGRAEGHIQYLSKYVSNFEERLNARIDASQEELRKMIASAEESAGNMVRNTAVNQKYELAYLACQVHENKPGLPLLLAQVNQLEAMLMLKMGRGEEYRPLIQAIEKSLGDLGANQVKDEANQKIQELIKTLRREGVVNCHGLETALAAAYHGGSGR